MAGSRPNPIRSKISSGELRDDMSADSSMVRESIRRSIEANRNLAHAHFTLAAALAQLGQLDEARSAVKAGLVLDPAFAVSRLRTNLAARSDNPTFLAQLEPLLEGMRKARVPEQ